jgi:N-acetylglucosaminyldiphosphoundecaprenol N-acetyl-beta-D-mannosaminyltransferase
MSHNAVPMRYQRPAFSRHILGMRVDCSSYEDAVAQVLNAAETRTPFWLCPASVQTVVEAHRAPSFRDVMDTANLVTTDGMPLVWALRLMGLKNASRVYGPTLTERILEAVAVSGVPVGFYGSSQKSLDRLQARLRERWPRLNIAYAFSPPYRPLTPEEDSEVTEKIQASGARILFVGTGCPRQEFFAWNHYRVLNIPILAVGAAFDFLAGVKPQAPAWMQSIGLEWFFRVLCEPRRLWRRALVMNPLFVLLFVAQMTGLRRFDPLRANQR